MAGVCNISRGISISGQQIDGVEFIISLSVHFSLGWATHVNTKLVALDRSSWDYGIQFMAKAKYCNFKFIDISFYAISVHQNCNRNQTRIADTSHFPFQFNFQHTKVGHACQKHIRIFRMASVEQKPRQKLQRRAQKCINHVQLTNSSFNSIEKWAPSFHHRSSVFGVRSVRHVFSRSSTFRFVFCSFSMFR